MTLNLRQKQTDHIIRMLNLNQPLPSQQSLASPPSDSIYKILIYDKHCQSILSPIIRVPDLRLHGVTLFFLIEKTDRRRIVDVPAVYFIQPTESNIRRVVQDAGNGIYEKLYLNFSSSVPRMLLEELAGGVVRAEATERIGRVYDQYLEFVTLEDGLFELGDKDCFVRMNDPGSGDKEIEGIVRKVVEGLFCVVATLGVVPVIRAPRGGMAEMVADKLDDRIREHLLVKNNLFSEGGSFGVASFQRPVLCVFDRSLELSVAIQHDFRYKMLVHDVLGLNLNRVSVQGEKGGNRSYELDGADPFWVVNGGLEFPDVAVEIETQLSKYKRDVEEVNRKTGGTNGAEFDGTELIGNTKNLMNAVNSLPEMTERKQVIDKHTNIATVLLGKIKERSLDSYAKKEYDMIVRGSIDRAELMAVLKGRGTAMDKLRCAIMYLISSVNLPQSEVEMVEAALREDKIDTSAFQYMKKIKSLNVSFAAANSANISNIKDWAGMLYGTSLSAVTAGMKNLLSGDRQLAVTRMVELLMEGKPNPEIDSYVLFDPRAPKSSPGTHLRGPFKEAIVFMIGGGNYVEHESLQELARRQQPARQIIYGTTGILTGGEFVQQLAVLGQKMGLGGSPVPPPAAAASLT